MGRNLLESLRGSGWAAGGVSVSIVAGGLGLAACQPEGPFLQTEQYSTTEGKQSYNGGACMPVQRGNAMGGGTAPGAGSFGGEPTTTRPDGFSFSYDGTGSGVRLQVVDASSTVLADRHYDAGFIASGKKDEVKVELRNGGMRFVSWGVERCESIRSPEDP